MRKLLGISGRNVFLLFIVTTVIYVVMLSITIPKLLAFSQGKEILDMMPGGYDATYVQELMSALSVEGRSYYLTSQLPVDFIYPAMFAVTYALVFILFLRKVGKHETNWKLIALLPVIAGLADYIENVFIIVILKSFPQISSSVVQFSSFFSIVKASATTLYFISLIILLIIVAVNTLRKRRLARQVR